MALQRSRDRHRLLPPQPPPPQPPPPMVLPLAAVQYHHQQRQQHHPQQQHQQHHQVQGMYQRGDVLHAAAPAAVPVLADLALAAYRQRASGISMADQHAAVLLAQRMQAAGWDERSFRHVQATPMQRIDTGNTSVHASRIDASVISDGSGRFSDSRVASVVPSYRTVEKQDMASVHAHRPGHERNVYWQPSTNMYSSDVTSRNYQRNLSPQSTHFRTQGNERYLEANGHYNSRPAVGLSSSRSQSDREVRKRSRERERERSPVQRAQRFPRIPEHRSGKQGYGRKVYPYIDSTFDRSKREDEDREDGQVTPPAKSPDIHEDRRRKLSHNTRVPDYARSQASFQDAHIADKTYSVPRSQRVSSQKRERSLLKDQNSPPKKSKFEEHDSDLSQPVEKKLTATGHKQTLKEPNDSANAAGKDVSADDRQVKSSSCCEVKVTSAAEASSDKDQAAAEVLPANNDQAFATFLERPMEENSSFNLDSKRLEPDSDAQQTLCGNRENEPLQMASLELSQEGHALVTHSVNAEDARQETPVQEILDSAAVLESRESDGGNVEVLDLNQVEVKADSMILGSGLTCDMAAVADSGYPRKGTTESLGMNTDVKVIHAAKSLELAKVSMEMETEQSSEQSDVPLEESSSSVSAIKSQEVCLSHMGPKEVDPASKASVPEQTKQAVLTIRKNPSIPVTFQPRVATTSKTWYRSGGLGNSPSASKLSNVFSATNSGGANGSAYIRKGNSLVRASGSVSNPKQPIKQSYKGRDSPLRTVVLKRHNTWNNPKPVEGPKSPPVTVGLGSEQAVAATTSARCSSEVESFPVKAQSTVEKSLPNPAHDHAPVDSSSVQVGLPHEAVSVDPLAGTSLENANEVGGSSLKDDCTQEKANNFSSESSKTGSTMLYIRSKANQLVVSPLSPSQLDTSNSRPGNSGADIYYKRKTNQLVRNNVVIESSGKSPLREEAGRNNLKSPETHVPPVMKTKLGRVLSLKKHQLQSSWVWTLNKVEKQSALLPWKRRVRGRARSRRLKALPKAKKGSLLFLMSKKLQALHKSQPLYTRSANGFSLRRSGVRSIGGANLKWTKSLEKRSREANEEVTKVLAAVEKQCREESIETNINRRGTKTGKAVSRERILLVGLAQYKMDPSRRTLQRLYESQESPNSAVNSSWNKNCTASALLTPGRSSIGGAVYVRMGNGNQLVRDPKASSRALASEKIRWSLHNVRSRVTKKQQYCQFFTRFGKCNKGDGKCPYVHDPDKVVVCTKFLKGTCTNTNCPLTHKVIPERMPDCSFFVQGLCINEECSYRHVNVNPQAPVCEGFLKGYCASGDQCNKKHTYVCPVYSVSGDCPERKTCKFHHPKKKEKPAVVVGGIRVGKKRKRRYFLSSEPPSNPLAVGLAAGDEKRSVNISEWTEFISLQDITLDDGGDTGMQEETNDSSIQAQEGFLCFDTMSDEDVERLIRPSFVLQSPQQPCLVG